VEHSPIEKSDLTLANQPVFGPVDRVAVNTTIAPVPAPPALEMILAGFIGLFAIPFPAAAPGDFLAAKLNQPV